MRSKPISVPFGKMVDYLSDKTEQMPYHGSFTKIEKYLLTN